MLATGATRPLFNDFGKWEDSLCRLPSYEASHSQGLEDPRSPQRHRRSYSFDICCNMRKPSAASQQQSGQCGPRAGKLDLTAEMKIKDTDDHTSPPESVAGLFSSQTTLRRSFFCAHRGGAPRNDRLCSYKEILVERFPCLLLPSEVELSKKERHLVCKTGALSK